MELSSCKDGTIVCYLKLKVFNLSNCELLLVGSDRLDKISDAVALEFGPRKMIVCRISQIECLLNSALLVR